MSHAARARRSWERLTEALVLPSPGLAVVDGGRIVIASEDARLRRQLATVLAADGHFVIEARNCVELLHHVGVTGPSLHPPPRPDALVIDLAGNTWAKADLLDMVCTGDWALPVIALVPPDDRDTRAEVERVGVRAVLPLPLDAAALRAELMSIVNPGAPLRGVA
jgi:DNA-binding response OmpR family regulator